MDAPTHTRSPSRLPPVTRVQMDDYVPPKIACAWLGKPVVSVAQFDTASLECVATWSRALLSYSRATNKLTTTTYHYHATAPLLPCCSELFAVSSFLKAAVEANTVPPLMRGKMLANVFYEASTRTMCSFAAAAQRLGGGVLPVSASSSSVKKGETLQDTMRCLECYADVLVLRHPVKGSAAIAAKYCENPVLNAGDGAGEHPTQALLDCYTIFSELGHLSGVTITMVGDLKYGRTVHSLSRLAALYGGVKLQLVSPAALALPQYVLDQIEACKCADLEVTISETLSDEILAATDILYVTRIQKERFPSPEAAAPFLNAFIISPETLGKMKESARVMHPLPRVGEILEACDADPRAAYFRQMRNGMFVRMALLALATAEADTKSACM